MAPSGAPEKVPGVSPLDARQVKFQRRAVLFLTIAPFVGFALAMWSLWGRGLTAVDVSIMAAFYMFTGLGITVGFHRLLTHGSFDCPRWVRGAFAVAGSMAVEGSVISWVADHRRHHAFSDAEGDPHSPHLDEGEGLLGIARGLFHAHIGWMLNRKDRTHAQRWAPDLQRDPLMRRIDSLFTPLVVLSFVLPALIGYLVTGTLWGAITAFLWGSLARVFVLHHVTWSINSICHFYGKRPFETTDMSTNNWVLSVISFGESWHNNHHAFPTSARHGLRPWQVDPGGILIWILEKLRLARNLRVPSPKQQAAKRIA